MRLLGITCNVAEIPRERGTETFVVLKVGQNCCKRSLKRVENPHVRRFVEGFVGMNCQQVHHFQEVTS